MSTGAAPTKTFRIYNDNKPWFNSKLRQLCQAKEDVFRSGDRTLFTLFSQGEIH